MSRQRSRKPWERGFALTCAALFGWTFCAAPAGNAAAEIVRSRATAKKSGRRLLSEKEMGAIRGAGSHTLSYSVNAGANYPWEGSVGDVNTGNGNKLTSIPIVGWTQRGGLPVSFSLNHNSESLHNSELGEKFTHPYDIYLMVVGTPGPGSIGNLAVHWGNDLSYTFTNSGSTNIFTAPTGIHDSLVLNVDSTLTLTRPNQTVYHFNTAYYCDTISDENGNAVVIAYNAGHYVTSITDCTSRAITLGYDGSNRINSITDPLSRVWSIAYTSGNLTSITYPELGATYYSTSLSYDTNHDITGITTPGSRTASFTYNSDSSIATSVDSCSNSTSYTYASGQTTITDPNGHVVNHYYNGSGQLSQIKDNSSYTWTPTYGSGTNNVTSWVDQRGYTWQASYDSNGNQLTLEDPYSDTTTGTFNSNNKLLTVTDANSHETQITRDSHDNITAVEDANSHYSYQSFDSHGSLASRTDALSNVEYFTVNTNGELTGYEDANSNSYSYTVNGLGWRTEVTDPLTHSVSTSYDAWGRGSSVTTPAGTTDYGYDADSNIVSAIDGNAHETDMTWDGDCRLLTCTKANADEMQYVYDGTGQKGLLSETTDGNNHHIYYSYNGLNQKTGVTYADSTSESWTYSPTGQIASHTDCNGATIDYSFDHADRLITTTYPDTSTVSLSWDAGDRLSSMVDSSGTTGYTMDAANRTTQIAAPNGTVGYGYDNADRRTSMTQSSLTWGYSYDAGNRLSSTTSPYSETTSNSWDAANRISTVTSGDSSVVYYSYDTANRPTEVKHKTSGGTVLTDYQYGYDAVNCTYQIDSDGTETNYGYDDSDQLTSEERDNTHSTGYTIAYTYDHNQNRLTKVLNSVTDYYAYDSANKLTGITGSVTKNYSYDSNGNCTSIAVGTGMSPPTTYLSYDYENRVVGITYPSTATNSFSYNGNDLRIKKVDSSGTRNYITDGDSPAAPVLSDGLATFTPGLGERRSGTSAFYHGDALGSTRDITNSSQSVTDTRRYDAFGMSISPTGSNPTPFGFVGGSQYQTDADSGLMLLGERYYDPSIGRFISQDPIQAGDNWYAYCENNPLGGTNALGLDDTRKIGPSGKPMIHIVPSNGRKGAKDKSRARSDGPPDHDPNDKVGRDPHYHAKRKNERRDDGVHYTYPRKGPAVPTGPKPKPLLEQFWDWFTSGPIVYPNDGNQQYGGYPTGADCPPEMLIPMIAVIAIVVIGPEGIIVILPEAAPELKAMQEALANGK